MHPSKYDAERMFADLALVADRAIAVDDVTQAAIQRLRDAIDSRAIRLIAPKD